MKYIRTKDGRIFDISGLLFVETDKPYVGEGIGTYQGIPIIKEADDIEELFDKFVICCKNGEKFIYGPFKLDGWIVEGTLYGAIWTDKGLICVAKLNEKGEWEPL